MFPTTLSFNNPNGVQLVNPPNTLPTEIATIPISQSQLYRSPTDIYTLPSQTSTMSNSISNTTSTTHHPYNLVRLHHKHQTNYILASYCKPITESLSTNQTICKFNRECIISKNKTLTKAPKLTNKSPTVFGSATDNCKKNNYNVVDTRLVSCFNPSCTNSKTKLPKVFHHSCYMHMINMSTKEEMESLYYEGKDDKLVSLIDKSIDMDIVNAFLVSDKSNLMFPFCGKRCFNSLFQYRNKKTNVGDSDYALTQNWEKDGSPTSRTSMMVLVNWISTQENCSSYFGGVDSKGNTSANRKETYHHHIRNLILKENGKNLLLLSISYCLFILTHHYHNLTYVK